MRIAVALFGEEVSPRWCVARQALVATVRDGTITERERLDLGDCSNVVRLARLHARGVSVLLCGGFDRRHLPLAQRLGVRVIWKVSGSAEDALRAFAGAPAANAASTRTGGTRSTGTNTEMVKERT
jgi:hypothetical protein